MRIISGSHKGRNIIAPGNLHVRPTTDIFNILHNQWELKGVEVLDLFSGIGSISYEFASRGAGSVIAVDLNYSCVRFITDTSKKLEFHQIKPIKADVFRFLTKINASFDIIFADPPYDMEGIDKIPDLIFENNLLKSEGNLVIEHPAGIDFSSHPGFDQHRKYSRVNFSFFSNH